MPNSKTFWIGFQSLKIEVELGTVKLGFFRVPTERF
jgi:hypothetical protein